MNVILCENRLFYKSLIIFKKTPLSITYLNHTSNMLLFQQLKYLFSAGYINSGLQPKFQAEVFKECQNSMIVR